MIGGGFVLLRRGIAIAFGPAFASCIANLVPDVRCIRRQGKHE